MDSSDTHLEEGQLAIDVWQTLENIVITAPLAGVRPEDLDISVTDETLIIKGERQNRGVPDHPDYLVQECYWGSFSRIYNLPVQVIADKAAAVLKDGILTVTIPKDARSRTKSIPVQIG